MKFVVRHPCQNRRPAPPSTPILVLRRVVQLPLRLVLELAVVPRVCSRVTRVPPEFVPYGVEEEDE